MTLIQQILIYALAIGGVAGTLYVTRPREEADLASVPTVAPAATTTPQVQAAQGGALNFFGSPPPEFAGYAKAQQQRQVPAVPAPKKPAREISITPLAETVRVTIKTSMGDIEMELYGEQAPLTVGNFVALAASDFYDGTTFHRVVPDFMIQGGDSLSKDQTKRQLHGTGQLPYEIPDEINDRKLVRGSVAMANRGPNTNGSQFFIVTKEALPHLDGRHTNFGQVVSGMDVVDAIANVEKDNLDNPLTPVVMKDVVVRK